MTVITAKWEDLLPQFNAFALGGGLGGSVSEDSIRGFSLGGVFIFIYSVVVLGQGRLKD